jgi:hypothetical protein
MSNGTQRLTTNGTEAAPSESSTIILLELSRNPMKSF